MLKTPPGEGWGSPRKGRKRVAQGESTSPGTLSAANSTPRSGRQRFPHVEPWLFVEATDCRLLRGLVALTHPFPGLADSPRATRRSPTSVGFHAFDVMMPRKKKKLLDDLSNSGWPFDYIVKAGQPARPKT